MRKFVITLAATGAAIVAATPASAQYFPQVQPYGYGAPYGNAYGYSDWRHAREFQARIDRVEWQINRLDRFNRIGDGRADRLRAEANDVERQLRQAARNGLNPYEANIIRIRIERLEQRLQYSVAGGYGRYDSNYGERYDRDHQRWHDRHDDDDDDRD
jgi:hypothetical protein